MLVAIIILSILLFFALTFIIVLGIDEGWHGDEWFATFLFIFLSPIWLVAKLVVNIKGKLEERRIRARRKEIETAKYKTEED
jgi:uncharacterized membrane protein YbhN (UPF0104 family)